MSYIRSALFVGLALVASSIWGPTALADHEDYLFKWPWFHTTTASVTGYPHTAHHACPLDSSHSCTNAFDFVIGDDLVVSATQGTVTFSENGVNNACWKEGRLGNFVRVEMGQSDLLYGHMEKATVVAAGTVLLQGDPIGRQGFSRNTTDGMGGCGEHLHFEWTLTRPDEVDGQTTVPLQGPNSTNSFIGELTAMGGSLRSYYTSNGGWGDIGWTHKHCPGACTLNMTNNRSWGRMQDFRHHPDGFGGEFETIHVADWDQTNAYLVDSVFWAAWAAGAAWAGPSNHPLSIALEDRGACPTGAPAGCISYQRFHLGFVWMDAFTGRTAIFCPDVKPPLDGNPDLSDALFVLGEFGNTTPRADINGQDGIDFTDVNEVLGAFGAVCPP